MTEISTREYGDGKKLHVVEYEDSLGGFNRYGQGPHWLFDASIHMDPEPESMDSDKSGWDFAAGDPELHKFSDRLVKPGGTVLDLGVALARNSLYFAMNGMNVVGIDNNEEFIQEVRALSDTMGEVIPGSFDLQKGDFTVMELPKESFDTVIIGSVFHMESRQHLFDLIERAYDAVKPGGHLYIRLVSKNMTQYHEMLEAAEEGSYYYEVKDDGHVIESLCGCSGVEQMDPTVFLDPLDAHVLLSSQGAEIVHSQTIPTLGQDNIMYGEDHKLDHQRPNRVRGYVTVLAQKPEAGK